jgi:hypothetical protein
MNTAADKSLSRYVLPRDLSNALQQLDDLELDSLVAASRQELQRRGRPMTPASRQPGNASARSRPPSALSQKCWICFRIRQTCFKSEKQRLAVIDAASVDGRRRLILIRRDNVERLLMIGGPPA